MIEATRRFIRYVLLGHAVLLVLVLGIVVVAARELYEDSRDQVIDQARQRQELLARQTGAGIESHYASILDNLDLINRYSDASTADAADAETQPSDTRPADTMPGGGGPPPEGAGGPGGGAGGFGGPGGGGRGDAMGGGGPDGRGGQGRGFFGGRGGQGREGLGPEGQRFGGPSGQGPNGQGAPGQGAPGRGEYNPNNPGERGYAAQRPVVPAGEAGSGRMGGRGLGARGLGASFGGLDPQTVTRQLRGRATAVFIYDRNRSRLLAWRGEGPDDLGPPDRPSAIDRPAAEQDTIDRVVVERMIEASRAWLAKVPRGAVSPFIKIADTHGNDLTGHLLVVPSANGQEVLAAFVPLANIRTQFLDPLNKEGSVAAALVDEDGVAMAALDARVVGHNILKEYVDPQVQSVFTNYISHNEAGSQVFSEPMRFGEYTLQPRIMAFEPVRNLPGMRWTVVIGSPLADTEAVVTRIYRHALFWAIFVGVSMTGILVSTSALLIRSRVLNERARHSALTRELNQAREIQLAWLPEAGAVPPGLEIAAVNLPASHISGDFYNWFTLPDGRVALAIGDVTGHGMSAAFLMATTQLLVRTTLMTAPDPGQCLQEVNRQLCMQAFRGQFVTMLLLVLDPAAGMVHLADAGHPVPLIGMDGVFKQAPVDSQLVLGVDENERYETQSFAVLPGASILLYTDGVVEAAAPDGQQFSMRHLMKTLSGGVQNVNELVAKVVEHVKQHCHSNELADDLTLVAVQLAPGKK